jgi:SOS response regulatory protein OraA/RecX
MSEINWGSLALHRLSVREYGSGELRAYLRRKGATSAEAEKVVEDLVERGHINDERYARVIARHQAHRDKGPAYVLMRLRQKGVNLSQAKVRELFQEALPESVESELELARRVVEKRYPEALQPACDPKERARAFAALQRRGFSRDAISRALGTRFG